jgi:hypothetical protein
MKCPKCKGSMKEGIALQNEYHTPSLVDDGRTGRPHMVQQTKTGYVEMVDVMKCKECGHSILAGEWK